MRTAFLPAHVENTAASQGASIRHGLAVMLKRNPLDAPAEAAQTRGEADVAALARVRMFWWYGLGILWIVNALLQAQPAMFTTSFVRGVLAPAAIGQPAWISAPMMDGMQLWERAPVLWNMAAVSLSC